MLRVDRFSEMSAAGRARVTESTFHILQVRFPRPLAYGYVIFLLLAYTIVAVHTPIAVYPDAYYDDGLFMMLGRSLAEGKWLGRFSQFTLMKGPGYPAFLAGANWLGISVSLAHALFHCFAITSFVAICHRFIKSQLISGI